MSQQHPATAKLRACPLFREFDAAELEALLGLVEPRPFPAGMEIVLKGDEGDSMFVVTEGEARAVMRPPECPGETVERFKVGDVFGDLAILKHECHKADLVAVTDCKVLMITSRLLRVLRHSSPSAACRLALAMLEIAGQRLRTLNRASADPNHFLATAPDGPTMMAQVA